MWPTGTHRMMLHVTCGQKILPCFNSFITWCNIIFIICRCRNSNNNNNLSWRLLQSVGALVVRPWVSRARFTDAVGCNICRQHQLWSRWLRVCGNASLHQGRQSVADCLFVAVEFISLCLSAQAVSPLGIGSRIPRKVWAGDTSILSPRNLVIWNYWELCHFLDLIGILCVVNAESIPASHWRIINGRFVHCHSNLSLASCLIYAWALPAHPYSM